MKKFLLAFIKCILFLTLAGAVLFGLNYVLSMHDYLGVYTYQDFYDEDEETMDVIFYGSSRAFADVNPAVLWQERGITSYVLASSNQALWETYHNIIETLKTQSPKVIAVEMYRCTETREYEESRVPEALFGMHFSKNKLDALRASVSEDSFKDYLLQYSIYHSSYGELTESDYRYIQPKYGAGFKGFTGYFGYESFDTLYDPQSETPEVSLSEKTEEYLRKILELAEESDTELLLFVSPYAGLTEEEKSCFNAAEKIAAEYGVTFVDFNEHRDEIGLDSSLDYAEMSHLSATGTEKFSSYLADFLSEHYVLENHYGDERYASWDLCLEDWERMKANHALTCITDMNEYAKALQDYDDRYVTVITMEGLNSLENEYLRGALASLGLYDPVIEMTAAELWDGREEVRLITDEGRVFTSEDGTKYVYEPADGGSWVLENGEPAVAVQGLGAYTEYFTFGNHTVKLYGTEILSTDADGLSVPSVGRSMYIDETEGKSNNNGISFLVYDTYLDVLVDRVAFDTLYGYQCFR